MTNKRYSCNDEYFSVPNLDNSYWAGFIAADGCIVNNNGLSIGLNHRDVKQLELFKDDIEYTGKIYDDKYMVKIYITSEKIVSDLFSNYNIINRKSLLLQPPNLTDDELIKAFIIGYIDGDGSVGYYNGYLKLKILGTTGVLSWIRKYFSLLYQHNLNKISPNSFGSKAYAYRLSGKNALNILSILKNVGVHKLERKWSF